MPYTVTNKKLFTLVLLGALFMGGLFMAPHASAQSSPEECRERYGSQPDRVERCISGETAVPLKKGSKCEEGYVETSFEINGTNCVPLNKESTNPNDSPIFFLLTSFLKFFSALVGVAVTGGIIYGGILWSTAKGNPSQVQKATAVISNAVLGLILYILMFAIINFLVPGGLFQ